MRKEVMTMSSGPKKTLEPWGPMSALAQVARALIELCRYLTDH